MKPFDQDGNFQSTVERSEIGRAAVRGAFATILTSGLGVILQIVATVVLSRILTPQDFGLVTIVTSFSLLLLNFGGNGFTEAIVQRPNLSEQVVVNLFWINVGAAALLSLMFAASGPLIARYYRSELLIGITSVASLTIFVTSFSVIHLALLRRDMAFPKVSQNDLIARALSLGISIAGGLAGWGYWALVAGAIGLGVAQSIGAWWLCRWVPGLPRRSPGTLEMVRFAVQVYGRFSVNYLARNTDNLLVGWRFGAVPLGFYKKAYDLFALSASQLISPMTTVAVSALSKLREDPEGQRRHMLQALSVVGLVGMGLSGILTLTGPEIIRILLGPGWETSGEIFTYFGPGVGMMLIYGTHGWIHLSVGRADRWLIWGLVELAVTGGLFLLSLPWGPAGIAAAWTVSFWILTPPAFYYAGRPIGLTASDIVLVVWRYVAAAVCAGLACVWLKKAVLVLQSDEVTLLHSIVRAVLTTLSFAAIYLPLVISLHGGLAPLRQLGRFAAPIRRKRLA